jgi:hypothetical protein
LYRLFVSIFSQRRRKNMAKIDLYGGTEPEVWGYEDGQTLFTERLSRTISQNLYNLAEAGAQLVVSEDPDSETSISDFQAFYGDLSTWISGSLTALDGEVPVPQPPSPPAQNPGGGSDVAIIVREMLIAIIRIGLPYLREWLERRRQGKSTGGIQELFKQAFLQLMPASDPEEWVSLLRRITEENEIRIDLGDGAIKIYPYSYSVDFDIPDQ